MHVAAPVADFPPPRTHLKSDGRLGRNFLLGTEGDATNLILAAAVDKLRLFRVWMSWLLVCLSGGGDRRLTLQPRRAVALPGQRPSAMPSPELHGCTNLIGCILALIAPDVRGMSTKNLSQLGPNPLKH